MPWGTHVAFQQLYMTLWQCSSSRATQLGVMARFTVRPAPPLPVAMREGRPPMEHSG